MTIFNARLPLAFLLLMAILLFLVVMLTIKVRRITIGIRLNARERPALSRAPHIQKRVLGYLDVTRRYRRIGMCIGLLIGIIATEIESGGRVLLSSNWFFFSVAGYFLGSLAGAWRSGVSSMGPQREASLVVRSRSDFVSEWLIRATYLTTCGAVVFFVSSLFEPSGLATEGIGVRTILFAGATIVASATDLGTRQLAKAARPSADEHVTAALDAIARVSSSDIAIAGLSLSLWLLSLSALSALPKTHEPVFVLLCFSVGVTAMFAAATVWVTARRGVMQPDLGSLA